MGSLAHRDAFLLEERERRPNALLLDNGNQAEDPGKAATVLSIMALHDYDAVGTGALDAAIASDYAREARKLGKIPLVRALSRGDVLDALCKPLRVRRIRGHTVGVTALQPAPPGSDTATYLARAADALRGMRAQCEFLVLLSQLGLEKDKELARACGDAGPDAIIGSLEAQRLRGPVQVGRSMLLPAGPGALRVGVAEISFPLWGRPRVTSAALVPARAGAASGEVVRMVDAFYRQEQAQFLRGSAAQLAGRTAGEGVPEPARCGRCHPRETASWRRTKHASAVGELSKRGRLVAECAACHSMRYRARHVFDRAASLGGVGCTGCHAVPQAASGTRCPEGAAPTRGEAACRGCHTPVHSPRFDYPQYAARAAHS